MAEFLCYIAGLPSIITNFTVGISMTTSTSKKIRVLHFVTGGFSGGSTQVALGLVRAQMASDSIEPLLVLRRKRRADPARIQQLRDDGVPLETVNDITHISTIWALIQVIKRFQPDILLAHGFSEHLWGRWAGLLARVPIMIHVEHNTRERYTWWRMQQAHFLTRYTARIVGVSEGVREVMIGRGFPAEKCIAILNGINLAPFAALTMLPFAQREQAVIMVSRFSKKKDHQTLVRALAILRQRGITLPAYFAGAGKPRAINAVKQLVAELGLHDQVHFLGYQHNIPQLLASKQFAVQCSRWEGAPLSLYEGMAAGCAVIATDIPGSRESIRHGENGYLHTLGDALDLANKLETYVRNPEQAAAMAEAARHRVFTHHSKEFMNQGYEQLFKQLIAADQSRRSVL